MEKKKIDSSTELPVDNKEIEPLNKRIKRERDDFSTIQRDAVEEVCNDPQTSSERIIVTPPIFSSSINVKSESEIDRSSISTTAQRFCNLCFDKVQKHRVVFVNDLIYLIVPERTPIVSLQFAIVSKLQFPSFINSDEKFQDDVTDLKRELCSVFEQKQMKLIFVEYYFKVLAGGKEHFEIHCYPIAKNRWDGENGIIDFFARGIAKYKQNSIQTNKIDLKEIILYKPLYEIIPKGGSYFCILFGMDDGWCYMINCEGSENRFANNFAEATINQFLRNQNPSKIPDIEYYEKIKKRSDVLKKFLSDFITKNAP